jgi:CHAD domain-containing protein
VRDVPLPIFGAAALERLQRAVLKRGRDMQWSNVERRHVLRIRIKRLRYACEFFAPCFARTAVKPFLKRLEALQDILGGLNDVAVARRLLGELAPRGADTVLAAGAGQARKALAARERALIMSLQPAWGAFEKRHPFWRAP